MASLSSYANEGWVVIENMSTWRMLTFGHRGDQATWKLNPQIRNMKRP